MHISVRSIAIACTIALVGCGGSATDSGSVTDSASVITDSPNLSVDFTASLLDGSSITLSEQLAQHPVALWFWAPG
ncbi:MAG: hypothetical protein ABI590_07350 [Ilumatobacteraceae bacterium]